MKSLPIPAILQGGLGAGVSGWRLAKAVSEAGGLGVVAGTALDVILARRLQLGDPGGAMRRALARFPIPGVAERILGRHFIEGGKRADESFRALPLLDADRSRERSELLVAANFVEVFLAREGHDGPVGVNYLEKIQLPTLPSLYGAMLAGVGVVLMGAGIPRAIPGILDAFAAGQPAELPLDVQGGGPGTRATSRFDPAEFFAGEAPRLDRPAFLAIVSSTAVASVLARKATGRIDGFVVEGSSAGGHNAPPRGGIRLDERGEPIFGARDVPDLEAIGALGLPFWIAGGQATPDALRRARSQGASGIQVGTAFAFCDESGIEPELKERVRARIRSGEAHVRTDPLASPTGFPFKVFQLDGTISEESVFTKRTKVCDLGYLRHAFERSPGRVGWRCPGEPEAVFLRSGGDPAEIPGRKCVCNGLMATIGLGQRTRAGTPEPALVTSGSDTSVVARLLEEHGGSYRAADVLAYLQAEQAAAV